MTSILLTPFTDNRVTHVDGLVVKTGKNVRNEKAWYEAYEDKSDIPYIVGGTDESIVMNFIDRSGDWKPEDIIEIIFKYRNYKPIDSGIDFMHYIFRIQNHINKNPLITNGEKLLNKLSSEFALINTFCHGDLSVYNIIPTATGIKLIDPLYGRGMFGCWQLDMAKLLFSLKFYSHEMHKYKAIVGIFAPCHGMDILIASECVRVATYKKQFSFIAENLINEL